MPVLVKCRDTGEKISKELAYMVPAYDAKGNIKSRTYWSSKDAYENHMLESDCRTKSIELFCKMTDYPDGSKPPFVFVRELKEWGAQYSYKVVLKAIKMSAEAIEYAKKSKTFQNEYNRVSYMCAIIRSRLMDAKRDVSAEKSIAAAMDRTENDINAANMDVKCGYAKGNRDISRFLEDD